MPARGRASAGSTWGVGLLGREVRARPRVGAYQVVGGYEQLAACRELGERGCCRLQPDRRTHRVDEFGASRADRSRDQRADPDHDRRDPSGPAVATRPRLWLTLTRPVRPALAPL